MPVQVLPLEGPSGSELPARERFHLSRRDFLAGLALIGTGLNVGCGGRVGSRGNPAGWYAWLADTHIGADPATTRQGQVMVENLRAVVDDILNAEDPPRGLLINGDLALDDGQPADYARLLAILKPLQAQGIPFHMTLGNHDDRAAIRVALAPGLSDVSAPIDKKVGVIDGPDIRFLLLDSLIRTGYTGGELGEAQRAWLTSELDARPRTATLLFVHHNLNAERESALHDTTALLELVGSRPQVKGVFFGHTHVWNPQRRDGLHLVNLPAVGYNFLRKQPLGWCAFRPQPDGGEVEMRPIGRDHRHQRKWAELRWRTA